MINPCCNNNRIIGSATSWHAAQATIYAVQHAMQHMPQYHHQAIQYYPSVGHIHQGIYPTTFITIPFY